jgi:hypothetical protein
MGAWGGRFNAGLILISIWLAGCGGSGGGGSTTASSKTTGTPGAEASIGERLFVETRFAQFFKAYLAANPNANVNDALPAGDPVVDAVGTMTPGQPLAGRFAGMSMNCRSCHFVDEFVGVDNGSGIGGMRTYTDFARRSPIPARQDGKLTAPRSSPPLVNASLDRPGGALFHFDAEFNSMEDLVAGTFTGRNFGWLPGQKAEAIAHIARVMRQDDGSGDIAQQFDGLPYRILFAGNNPSMPDELRLPPEFRAFIGSGTDQEIFDAVVKVVAAYAKQLLFSQSDDAGNLIRSPFDVFLQMNGLPQQPNPGETDLAYSRRLLTAINTLGGGAQFVTSNPNLSTGQFQFHSQPFVFGQTELDGLKIFLTEPANPPVASGPEIAAGKVGNCIACHAAPNFTDFKLHNTGTTQREYDTIHGQGAFGTLALSIPNLGTRDANYNAFLPATEQHPTASERFRSVPILADPQLTDLGVWNVFKNPDMPNPQAKIKAILCDENLPTPCPSDTILLGQAIARFKTPGLRDLGHSAPYMHTGQFDTLNSIIGFYLGVSAQSRGVGTPLTNGDLRLQGIALVGANDIAPLVAFLNSLNEDYQ